MGLLSDLIIGSTVGGLMGSEKGGVIGALLDKKDPSVEGAVLGGIIGSIFDGDEKEDENNFDFQSKEN